MFNILISGRGKQSPFFILLTASKISEEIDSSITLDLHIGQT